MKKVIALVLSLCMVCAMMSVAASATTGDSTGGTGITTNGTGITTGGTGTTTGGTGTTTGGTGTTTGGTGTTTGGTGTTTGGTGTTTGGSGTGGAIIPGGDPVPAPGGGSAPSTPDEPNTPTNPFTDVSNAAYYYDAVLWLMEKGITEGVTATSFQPSAGCTRGQMVTFLWRAAGCPEPAAYVNPFADVAESAYYYKAVLWAVEKGITNGMTATAFAPNEICTRGQMAAYLYRHAGSPAVSGDHGFNDVNDSNYFDAAVIWLLANNITNGTTDTTYSPYNNCTRGQMAAFLYRYFAE